MMECSIYKPSEYLSRTRAWEHHTVNDLPEVVGGQYPLKHIVESEIHETLHWSFLSEEGYAEGYDKAFDEALGTRLAALDAQHMIDLGEILDGWAEAETFDPARVTTTKAAWVLVGQSNTAIVEAELVDSDSSPNGKDWATHAYTYSDGAWSDRRQIYVFAPDGRPLREYAKSSIARIADVFTPAPNDVTSANLKKALRTEGPGEVSVVRVMPEDDLADYLDVLPLEDAHNRRFTPEVYTRGPVCWQTYDRPVIPNLARKILEHEATISAKAGPYNINVGKRECLPPWEDDGVRPNCEAWAAITIAPQPGFEHEEVILQTSVPFRMDDYARDAKEASSAKLKALRDLLDREGFTRFDSIEINDRECTNDFDVLLELTKLDIAQADMKYPHPADFEKLNDNYFTYEAGGVEVAASNHGDMGWSLRSSCAGQPPRTYYGSTFEEAYTHSFEAQKTELSLKEGRRLCINNPEGMGGKYFTDAAQIDFGRAPAELLPRTAADAGERKGAIGRMVGALNTGMQRVRAAR